MRLEADSRGADQVRQGPDRRRRALHRARSSARCCWRSASPTSTTPPTAPSGLEAIRSARARRRAARLGNARHGRRRVHAPRALARHVSLSGRADHHAHRPRRALARASRRCGSASTNSCSSRSQQRAAARASCRCSPSRARWCGAATITVPSRASSSTYKPEADSYNLSTGRRRSIGRPPIAVVIVNLRRARGRERPTAGLGAGGLSPRHRPGHDLDPRHRVRCRARAGRDRAAGIPPDLSGARAGRARSGGDLDDDRRDRARRDGEGGRRRAATSPAIGITNQRETTVVWDRADRQADPQRHRLAGPPHRRRLRRAARRPATSR